MHARNTDSLTFSLPMYMRLRASHMLGATIRLFASHTGLYSFVQNRLRLPHSCRSFTFFRSVRLAIIRRASHMLGATITLSASHTGR